MEFILVLDFLLLGASPDLGDPLLLDTHQVHSSLTVYVEKRAKHIVRRRDLYHRKSGEGLVRRN
jgi:hypothetical protein